MAFTRRSFCSYPIFLTGSNLPFVACYKYLGVIIDRGLTWSRQITALGATTGSYVNVLRRLCGSSWGPSCTDLLQVHNSLIMGTLRYCLPVLHGISPFKERQLINLQARSLRTCLGVPKTTETFSAIAEARVPSVLIIRDTASLQTYTRCLVRHPCHHLRDVTQHCPASAYGQAVLRLQGQIPPSHTLVSYTEPLWTLSLPPVHTSVPGLPKKSHVPAVVACQLTLQHLYSLHSSQMEIYTDGSVASDGSPSAFYIPEESYERGFKLVPTLSSTEAEAFAILSALRYISSSTPRAWTILSDSKSALEAVASYSPKVINDIYTEIICLHAKLSSLGHSVCFQWIPGHVGILGNAIADSAARSARAAGAVTSVQLTPSACQLAIRRYCRNSSQAFFQDAARTNPFLHSIDPTMTHTLVGRYPREEESLLHRLRLNVARTPLLLFKMGHLLSPKCPTCHPL
ncbi:uncharacterized protein LOC135381131 [Ornithodoros turicata]|uniref:uncharacterized protein LOC135381131 n=1 Tax=Ornithodoros turicata TaxID=34597 RepID=UPI003138FFA3